MTTPGDEPVYRHLRQLRKPELAWCRELMPDDVPEGLFETCPACLSAVMQDMLGRRVPGVP